VQNGFVVILIKRVNDTPSDAALANYYNKSN